MKRTELRTELVSVIDLTKKELKELLSGRDVTVKGLIIFRRRGRRLKKVI